MSTNNSDTLDSDLERERLLNTLLEQTLDLDESERNCFLEANCPDEELRQEVLELLDEDLGDFLEVPPVPGRILDDHDCSASLTALFYFGTLALTRGDYTMAARQLGKAVQMREQNTRQAADMDLAILYRSLGKALAGQQRSQEAIAQIQKAVDILRSLPVSPKQKQELNITLVELVQCSGFEGSKPAARSVLDLIP